MSFGHFAKIDLLVTITFSFPLPGHILFPFILKDNYAEYKILG
jgi:hypothetical protein